MPTSTLTSRGRVTIPEFIQEVLPLQPSNRVEFILEDDQVVLRQTGADLTELDGTFDRLDRTPVSLEAMQEAVEHNAG